MDFANRRIYIGNEDDHHLELQDVLERTGLYRSDSVMGMDIVMPDKDGLAWGQIDSPTKKWSEADKAIREYFGQPQKTIVSKVSCHYADGRSADH